MVTFLALWCGLFGLRPGGMSPAQAQEPAAIRVAAATRIEPGCVLEVTVVDEPALSGRMTVDADGNLKFVLTDDDGANRQEWKVNVRDKTAEEAVKLITESLKVYLRNPQVSVLIARMPQMTVEVRGAARNTGALELPRKSRLSDALARCEYRSNAELTAIQIIRKVRAAPKPAAAESQSGPVAVSAEPSRPTPKTRIFTANFVEGDDPELEPGDIITLPALPERKETTLQTARVIGEVAREVEIPIGPGMKVKDALERIGGLGPNADRDNVRLIRANGKDYKLNADKVLEDDPVYNLAMNPGDLIIVGRRDRSLSFAVLGAVTQERTFEWKPDQKVTLLEAIEMAGGLKKEGDRSKVVVRRGYLINPAATQDITFNLDKIAQGKEPNIELEAGDAIYVMPRERKPNFFQQFLPLLFRFLPFALL